MRGRFAGAVLASSLVALMLGSGWSMALTPGGDAPEVDIELPGEIASTDFFVGQSGSHLTWSTTYSGNVAFRLELAMSQLMQCDMTVDAAGNTGTRSLFFFTSHDKPGKTWTAWTQPYPLAAAHFGNAAIETNTVSGVWVAQATHRFTLGGTEPILVSAPQVRPHSSLGGKSMIVDIDCPASFTVTKVEAGGQILGFTTERMRGGVGATWGIPPTSTNLLDEADKTFSKDKTYARYRSTDLAAAGLVRITGPGGTQQILTGDDDVFADGPAGTWGIEVQTRTSVGPQKAVGVIVGLDDVPSLSGAF